jgi:putative membrane protein
MKLGNLLEALVASALFAAVGLAVFLLAFWLITKITPFSIRKEIEEDQNTALGIIIAGVIIGVSLIIAAAVHG